VREISFTPEQKVQIVYKIKYHFNKELGEEIGQFDAEFLLEFFGKEIGPYFYNQGLHDAQGLLESQMDMIREALYTMEEPTL